jgi:hypothetical protein
VKWLLGAQAACFAREDEVRGEGNRDTPVNEFGLRSLISFSMTDRDQYWDRVKEKCFALATKLSPLTFF